MKPITFHAPDPEIAGRIIIDRGISSPCDVFIVIELPEIDRYLTIYLGKGEANLEIQEVVNEGGDTEAIQKIDLLKEAEQESTPREESASRIMTEAFDSTTVDEDLWGRLEGMDDGDRVNVPITVVDLKRIKTIVKQAR